MSNSNEWFNPWYLIVAIVATVVIVLAFQWPPSSLADPNRLFIFFIYAVIAAPMGYVVAAVIDKYLRRHTNEGA